eukprot:s2171_g10.t1
MQQNQEILKLLRPQLLLLGQELPSELMQLLRHGCRQLVLEKAQALVADGPMTLVPVPVHQSRHPAAPPRRAAADGLLCFQLTGGTTGASKCVEIAQRMALHEFKAYPKAFPELSHEDRILQHTPVLWAASAIGQINIAASFGARLCIADELDQASVQRHGATVLGVVPSSLDALQPAELPTARWIFTWGEALPAALGQKWRQNGRVVELLIRNLEKRCTEYWLSLYSEGRNPRSGRSVYCAVEGAEDGTGELCLRGPMVTPGYRGGASSFVEAADGGDAFFKTCDTVTLQGSQPESLEFKGRSDMLIKVAGQFHYLSDIEERLKEAMLPPPENTDSGIVQEVAVLPATKNSANDAPAHVFISVLGAGRRAAAARLVERARAVAPHSVALHFLGKPLPKDPVSTKVDRQSLLKSVAAVAAEPQTSPVWPALRARLWPQLPWGLMVAMVGGLNLTSWLRTARASRPTVKNLVQLLLHVAAVPYLWLLSLHVPIHFLRSWINYVPFGRVGVLLGSRRKAVAARVSLAACTAMGASTLRRDALFPWWLAFWLAVPDQVQMECGWWLKLEGWKWYMDEVTSFLAEFKSRSISITDNTIEAICSAPEMLQETRKRLREKWLPYQPPEELQPQRPEPQCLEGLKDAKKTPLGGSPPQFLPVAQECDAPAESSAGPEAMEQDEVAVAPEEAPVAPEVAEEVLVTPEVGEEAPVAPEVAAAPEVAEEIATPEVAEGVAVAPEVAEEVADAAPEVAEEVAPAPLASPAIGRILNGDSPEEIQWSCVECRVALPWGSDWRQEGEDFYCKSCHRGFDDRWWDFHTRDVITLDVDSDTDATEQHGQGQQGPGVEAKTAAGQVVLRLLAQQLGQLTSDTRLSGVDSLAVLTLCRQLRLAVPGRECIKPQDFFRCGSVGELLQLVEQQQECDQQVSEASGDKGEPRTIWFAPGQVNSTCKWLYGCKGLLDVTCFRRAAARLLARHEGLRAEMESPAGMELLRFLRDTGPLHAMLWQHLELALEGWPRVSSLVRKGKDLVSWSMKESWPKSVPLRLTQEFLKERVRVVQCRSWREVEQASDQMRRSWKPPIAIGLFLLESAPEGDDRAARPEDWTIDRLGRSEQLLAVCGVSCLLRWLLQCANGHRFRCALCSRGGSLAGESSESRAGRLLPLRPGAAFEVLEQRFLSALEGSSSGKAPVTPPKSLSGVAAPVTPPEAFQVRNTSEVRSVPKGRTVAPWRRDEASAIAASPVVAPVESEFVTVLVDPSPPRGNASSTVPSGSTPKAVPEVLYPKVPPKKSSGSKGSTVSSPPEAPNPSVHPKDLPKAPGSKVAFEVVIIEEEPKSVAIPKESSKAVVIPKAKGSGVPVSQARPLELRPQGGPPVASTASSAAGVNPTVRLSLDLHGVLDLGASERGRWSTVACSQLATWLSRSPYNQAGVCSYIGTRGEESQIRRDQALSEVRRFNNTHNTDLRICITADRAKSELQAHEISVHIDDKVDICRRLNSRGVPNICLNPNLRSPPADLVVVRDIVEAFEALERLRLVPRVWARQWPGIFRTG